MTMMQIAKKATVQSKVLIAKMDWWQKVIWNRSLNLIARFFTPFFALLLMSMLLNVHRCGFLGGAGSG